METNKHHEDSALRQALEQQSRQTNSMKLSDGFTARVMQKINEDRATLPSRKTSRLVPLSRVAAVIAVTAIVSGIAYAAYYAAHHGESADLADNPVEVAAIQAKTDNIVKFEGQQLRNILGVVAPHYRRVVSFVSDEPGTLRISTEWDRSKPLSLFIETLNEFDGLRLTDRSDTIFVESGKVEK